MLGLLKRHEVQVLLRAGHSRAEVARLTGVSPSEIRRIEAEGPIEHFDDAAERRRRKIGRPSKAGPMRDFVVAALAAEPRASTQALLEGAKAAGYAGSKSAFYALVSRLRPQAHPTVAGVGELPGEVSEHGFGEVDVRFVGTRARSVAFFVSQLTFSRWSEATIVADRCMESLLRTLVAHFERIGGVPLLAVFDRHNASAIVSGGDGPAGPWHPAFAQALLDLGLGVELRGRGPREKSGASVERLVRWVKSAFFRGRRFADDDDLRVRLAEWTGNVNTRLASRSTSAVPAARMAAERARLRPLAVRPDEFALRLPVVVGPGGALAYEGATYQAPPETEGRPAVLHVLPRRLRLAGATFSVEFERRPRSQRSEFPE